MFDPPAHAGGTDLITCIDNSRLKSVLPTSPEMDSTIRVNVLFFGAARDATGTDEAQLTLNPPHDSHNALEQVLNTYPALRRFGKSLLFAVNQEYAGPDREISDGDELAIFPPVSGGSENKAQSQTAETSEESVASNAESAD